jgi:fructokinase
MRIGIDVGGTKIAGIALEGSTELARQRIETPRGDYAATLDAIVRLVSELERMTGSRGSVGVGIPGTLSPVTGLVKNANSVCLIGRPLGADLDARLGRPVRIANDANCFVVSEATDGAASGTDVVFGIIVGTGTGAGVVVRGELLVGQHGIAGEWGHNPLPWPDADESPGPPCYCGRSGCIETFLSGPGLAHDFQQRTGRSLAAEQIVALAGGGSKEQDPPYADEGRHEHRAPDPEARLALARYENRMARALAAVVNVLDPGVIVLGGGLSNIDRLYENVPRLWHAWVFGASGADPVRTRLSRPAHGEASGVRGAAWLWPDDSVRDGSVPDDGKRAASVRSVRL